jgi:hypothetical protein
VPTRTIWLIGLSSRNDGRVATVEREAYAYRLRFRSNNKGNDDMAKAKRKGATKADAIRSYLSSNPKAKTKEVVEALTAQGTKVSANHVYLIKSKGKAKVRKAKGAKLRAVAASRPGIKDHADAVNQVKMLAHQLGGMSSLKALVDALVE